MKELKSKEDSHLIELYKQSKDIAIVSELFGRYRNLVYGTCLKYLQNHEEAEDITQELFLHITQKLIEHEVKEFRPWLYVSTKNQCFDLLRKKKRNLPKENEASLMYSDQIYHPDDIVDQSSIHKLNSCIDHLPEEQKQCIKLFYIDQQSYNDIEKGTGFNWNSIRSYIQNGRRNIKNCMDKK